MLHWANDFAFMCISVHIICGGGIATDRFPKLIPQQTQFRAVDFKKETVLVLFSRWNWFQNDSEQKDRYVLPAAVAAQYFLEHNFTEGPKIIFFPD